MDTETTPVEKKGGISRRAVIVGGAVGTAAFWSVPVITSVAASASTGSTGATLPCSWAIVVYVEIGTGSVDNYTYFVNGFAKAGSCQQGEFGAQCSGTEGPTATWLSPIEVEFDGSNDTVTITDTVSLKKLAIDLHGTNGGSGPLTAGGAATGSCSQGVLSQNGTAFSLPSGYAFLAALSFQGCDGQFPTSQSSNLTVNCS